MEVVDDLVIRLVFHYTTESIEYNNNLYGKLGSVGRDVRLLTDLSWVRALLELHKIKEQQQNKIKSKIRR